MIGLALLLLVRENGGSYAAAAPSPGVLRRDGGRRADRGAARRPARPGADPPLAGVIFPALLVAVCALALLDAPLAAIGAAAAAAGA